MMQGIRYNKPLTLADRLLIDTVTTRYEGVEAPFIAFDRGDHIELKCPPTIRRATPYATKTVEQGKETSLLRVPAERGN